VPSPIERFVELPAGRFRVLEWPGSGRPVVFLHGLTAVADVWGATVEALGAGAPPCVAIDQRGHGQSHPSTMNYSINAYVADATSFIRMGKLDRPHLVGHSMGGRVAMVLAARHPELIRSVAIVEIGPEQWKANWEQSVAAFAEMPHSFADEAAALAFAGSRVSNSPVGTGAFLSRLREEPDGSFRWRADIDALAKTVQSQRSRNHWSDWEALQPPALFVRGETSHEVRQRIATAMRRRNPAVKFVELEGVSHNVPLIAPERLAIALRAFWAESQ
jgi:pimeloyl-ACP methyl ester carboxylesterase